MEDSMRIRIVTLLSLMLASTAALAFEAQTPVPWPPKAVPNPEKGEVPDARAENKVCMGCHKKILYVKTVRDKKRPNLHRLHLTSKKTAFGGANLYCATCHETVTPAEGKAARKEGWFIPAKSEVPHPDGMLAPAGVWKKTVVRAGEGTRYDRVDTLLQSDPHPFKPTLGRLVCADCHGPESGIKTFYGAPQ